MLSVGQNARRFSPSQNIHVIKSALRRIGNVHYRQQIPTGAPSVNRGADGGLLWGLLGGQLGRKSVNRDRRSARVCAGDHRYGSGTGFGARPTPARDHREPLFLSDIQGWTRRYRRQAALRAGRWSLGHSEASLAPGKDRTRERRDGGL